MLAEVGFGSEPGGPTLLNGLYLYNAFLVFYTMSHSYTDGKG